MRMRPGFSICPLVRCRLLMCMVICRALFPVIASSEIVGGSLAKISSMPFLVSVSNSKAQHFCGGAIISPSWVVTAAHCVVGKSAGEIFVRAGSQYKGRGGQLRNVSSIVVHEEFDVFTANDRDIALLELEPPLELGDNVHSVPMADSRDHFGTGEMCLIGGWGVIEYPKKYGRGLRIAMVPLVGKDVCQQSYDPDAIVTDAMLCAGGTGPDACQGDSGGPLVCRGKFVGIVSWGRGCGAKGDYGVYTSIAALKVWILFQTGII
ncbi:trypsin-4-like [Toxorhynchites rutilus septentrionalis]|uniref:trypsin-4-like n=1 Tax=Toxorhynchites rutilus septentrionalis TaxID=329112 RepID=UPI00247A51AC|nr:trypsin-4-like [Toxorhynchites rutilus septentrionalis]